MCHLALENHFWNPAPSCKLESFMFWVRISVGFLLVWDFFCSFKGITVSNGLPHWLCLFFSLIANGDLINPASRLLIPRKALNQWDHVLQMVTEKITLRSGAVHRYVRVIFCKWMGSELLRTFP